MRPGSASEATETASRLGAIGIVAAVLALRLDQGSALAARARRARYGALLAACRQGGIVHLLLGHHADDQAETLMIRALAGSGNAGLAGMPMLAETDSARLLRPLLAYRRERLHATLLAAGLPWVEDPSNADPHAQRARLRARLVADGIDKLSAAAQEAGADRADRERVSAATLADWVTLHEAGFATLTTAPIDPARARSVAPRYRRGRARTLDGLGRVSRPSPSPGNAGRRAASRARPRRREPACRPGVVGDGG